MDELASLRAENAALRAELAVLKAAEDDTMTRFTREDVAKAYNVVHERPEGTPISVEYFNKFKGRNDPQWLDWMVLEVKRMGKDDTMADDARSASEGGAAAVPLASSVAQPSAAQPLVAASPLLADPESPLRPGGVTPLVAESPPLELEDVAPYVAQAGHRALADVLARVNRFLWCDERIARAISRVTLGLHHRTRLAHAARVGDVARVEFLIEHGAAVSQRDSWGRSALTEAVKGGHAGVAEVLRALGAEEDVAWEGVDVTAAGNWGPWVAGAGGGQVAAGAVDPVYALAVVSCDEVAVGHRSGAIIMRDLATGGARVTLVGHTLPVRALVSLPHGRLASGSEDGSVRVWCVNTGVCERALVGFTSLAVLLSGLLASSSDDRTVRLWDTTTGACAATLQHTSWVHSLAALPCGDVASGCSDGSIALWSAGGVHTGTLGGGAGYGCVHVLTRLQDGRLAAGYGLGGDGGDNSIRVWDLSQRELDARLIGHTSLVFSLTVLPDGRLLSGSWDSTIRVWGEGALSVRGGGDTAVCAATLVGHTDAVYALVVLRDGAVASGSSDGSMRFWK